MHALHDGSEEFCRVLIDIPSFLKIHPFVRSYHSSIPAPCCSFHHQVQEGDIVTMCSSTFGDEMWSCRGAGLSRVLSAIRLRAGPTVKLVFENSKEGTVKAQRSAKAAQAEEAARAKAQAKKDSLLEELQKDEQRLKKGKFLGLF